MRLCSTVSTTRSYSSYLSSGRRLPSPKMMHIAVSRRGFAINGVSQLCCCACRSNSSAAASAPAAVSLRIRNHRRTRRTCKGCGNARIGACGRPRRRTSSLDTPYGRLVTTRRLPCRAHAALASASVRSKSVRCRCGTSSRPSRMRSAVPRSKCAATCSGVKSGARRSASQRERMSVNSRIDSAGVRTGSRNALQRSRSGTRIGKRAVRLGDSSSRNPSGASTSSFGIAPSHASHATHRQKVDLPEPGSPAT